MLDTKKLLKRTFVIYIFVSLLCVLINYVYSLYGHGVTSDCMTYAFVYPLVLGVIVYLIAYRGDMYGRVSYNLYNAGVGTLTVGSIYQGVIDIAGADTTYSKYYYIIGTCLIVIAIVCFIIQSRIKKNEVLY